jgi:hypothetical protein
VDLAQPETKAKKTTWLVITTNAPKYIVEVYRAIIVVLKQQ